jgi:hypothetical protein
MSDDRFADKPAFSRNGTNGCFRETGIKSTAILAAQQTIVFGRACSMQLSISKILVIQSPFWSNYGNSRLSVRPERGSNTNKRVNYNEHTIL